MDKRDNKCIFEDTMRRIEESSVLSRAVLNSIYSKALVQDAVAGPCCRAQVEQGQRERYRPDKREEISRLHKGVHRQYSPCRNQLR